MKYLIMISAMAVSFCMNAMESTNNEQPGFEFNQIDTELEQELIKLMQAKEKFNQLERYKKEQAQMNKSIVFAQRKIEQNQQRNHPDYLCRAKKGLFPYPRYTERDQDPL